MYCVTLFKMLNAYISQFTCQVWLQKIRTDGGDGVRVGNLTSPCLSKYVPSNPFKDCGKFCASGVLHNKLAD